MRLSLALLALTAAFATAQDDPSDFTQDTAPSPHDADPFSTVAATPTASTTKTGKTFGVIPATTLLSQSSAAATSQPLLTDPKVPSGATATMGHGPIVQTSGGSTVVGGPLSTSRPAGTSTAAAGGSGGGSANGTTTAGGGAASGTPDGAGAALRGEIGVAGGVALGVLGFLAA